MESKNRLNDIQGFLEISDRLGTAGQPHRDQFALLPDAGYQAVINLAMPDSWDAVADEGQIVANLSMEYIPIPVVWESPQLEDLHHFFAAMDRLEDKKVFVHCARNMRVSAFVYLYRVLRLGETQPAALADLHLIWQPNPVWQGFIDQALQSYSSGDQTSR